MSLSFYLSFKTEKKQLENNLSSDDLFLLLSLLAQIGYCLWYVVWWQITKKVLYSTRRNSWPAVFARTLLQIIVRAR